MLFYSISHDDIRRESRRQLYKPVKEAKDGTPTYQVPPFIAVLKYVLERVDALPKRKWLDVANQPVPFSIPVMEQVSYHFFSSETNSPVIIPSFVKKYDYLGMDSTVRFKTL